MLQALKNLMNRILINGASHGVEGKNVKIVLMVDGVIVDNNLPKNTHIQWYGDTANVACGSLTVEGNVNGKVDCGSLKVEGDLTGNVDCGSLKVDGNITSDRISAGSVSAGGSIKMRT